MLANSKRLIESSPRSKSFVDHDGRRERSDRKRNDSQVFAGNKGKEPMPMYEIEQYELHVSKYRVEAKSDADAITKLFNGEADLVDNSTEYIEVADDLGMPVDENRKLAEELRTLGETIGEYVIDSIRSIEQVD